jgi:very-short-patch-repair endonuclease
MSLKWMLAVLVIVVVALAIAAVLVRSKRAASDGPWPFFAKKPLTQPEQVLYFRLVRALPESIVLAQVQLSRLLGVKKRADYQSWLNRISQMSADFVVCAKDASVLAVIELDDASHQSERRKAADEKKTRALEAAGIKLVRWNVRELPDDPEIRASLLSSTLP